jgi:hypothetical protein
VVLSRLHMIKELFLAIILGALLGLGVTGGFFALNKNKNNSVAQNITPTIAADHQTASPTPIKTTINSNLIISSPKTDSIVSTAKVTVSGTTIPGSTIIITTSLKSFNTTATSTGIFSTDIDLDSGLNQVRVTSINGQDEQTEVQFNITYSTAKI